MLCNSNGFYCVKARQVRNAGAQHLKEANELLGINPMAAQAYTDKERKDYELRNQLVMITRGHLKGYKGNVVSANETSAEIHVHSKGAKILVPRSDIQLIMNEMEGMRYQQNNNMPVYLSFDEAARQEYVNA